MKTIRLSAIALTALMAFTFISCEKGNDVPDLPKEVKITYGETEFSLISFSSAGYKEGKLYVPFGGEESQLVLVAKKSIYRDGVLSNQTKQSKVSDMTIQATTGWIKYNKSAVNDSTLQVALSISENIDEQGRVGELSVTVDKKTFKIDISQAQALIAYSAPVFQNDSRTPELLFSRSGDTERTLRFRAIAWKIVNGKVTEQYRILDESGWTWQIDQRSDIFRATAQGTESQGVKFVKLKASANESGLQVDGNITMTYNLNDVRGSINVPLTSSKDFIIDIEDGRDPVFH